MRVFDVMSEQVCMISANASVGEAARLMAAENVGFLPVQEGDRLVGTVTDRDLVLRCLAQNKDASARVRDVMTYDVRYCFEEDDLDAVIDNMAEQQIRRMPVVNLQKRLVGVLSLADAARIYSPAAAGIALSGVTSPGGMHCGDQNSRWSR
jgi:CBS domain-containing protein